jgi:hypothetical protein
MGGPLQHWGGDSCNRIFRCSDNRKEALWRFCAGLMSEMQSVVFAIFKKKQVTCVGARVMVTSHYRRATMH